MIRGTLIAESLRLNDPLDAVPLLVQDQPRWIVADLPDSQPTIWTLLAFTADESLAEKLADALAGVLDPAPGWYCDFRTRQRRSSSSPDASSVTGGATTRGESER